MTTYLRSLFLLGCLALIGFGCTQQATFEITDPQTGERIVCPDLCASICAGEPEPTVPRGCPMPACACN